MKINKKTNIRKLGDNNIVILINHLAYHCEDILGINKRKKRDLKFELIDVKNPYYGYYEPITNKLVLNLRYARNMKDFIKTFIHEYTHYKQPIRSQYDKLYKKYGYKNHPFEIEARNNEDKYWKETYKIMKKTFDSIK